MKGCEVSIECEGGIWPLTGFPYKGGILHPDPSKAGVGISFVGGVVPTWEYQIPNGLQVIFSLLIARGSPSSILTWELRDKPATKAKLIVRPFLSWNKLHALQKESGVPLCDSKIEKDAVSFLYPDSDNPLYAVSSGSFNISPNWYHSVYYEEEEGRGYDSTEDLYSPGYFEIQLGTGGGLVGFSYGKKYSAQELMTAREVEVCRRNKLSRLEFSSEQFLVKRNSGSSIIAGYPWFSDWGRDAFISLRGLCLPFARIEESLSILSTWGSGIKDGLIPNSFSENGSVPIYNSVDAALWYVIASYETFKKSTDLKLKDDRVLQIKKNIQEIIQSFLKGTSFNIGMDSDFLLRAGVAGFQLTWMDAKIDNEVVTPRIGKPVEVQALWINSLRAAAAILNDQSLGEIASKAENSFNIKFWNDRLRCLYDVVDVDHKPGQNDDTLRPNQIFALGGLPWTILSGERAKDVLNLIESDLLTPVGLKTLSTSNSQYFGRYEGSQRERDHAYHQGTVWLWLMGAFVDAWLRARGYSQEAKNEARARFLAPLSACAEKNNHLPEIADGDYPHLLRGSPFQAWSLGELIRISEMCRGDEDI